MSQSHHLHLHLHLSKRKRKTLFEAFVNTAAFLYPLSGIPQVVAVYQGSAEGVSVASWVGFTVFATVFFVYGLVRNIKPMIIVNGLWMIVDVLTIAGVLLQ